MYTCTKSLDLLVYGRISDKKDVRNDIYIKSKYGT